MKRTLNNSQDIAILVNAFYDKVKTDAQIGHFFTEVVILDWEVHIPKICSFWEGVLLGEANYRGNPMLTHIALNKKMPLKSAHFTQWLHLWQQTVDEYFEGELADIAKQKATIMADLMQYKITQSQLPHFIQ
jgi:hemoglobin